MDFGKLAGMAKNVASNFDGDDKKDDQPQQQGSGDKWSDVGSAAKQAFSDYQDKEAKGEKPDYAEIGNVAKQAYGAYSSDGGPKDATSIGKAVASGLFGHKAAAAPAAPPAAAPEHHDEAPKPEEQVPEMQAPEQNQPTEES
jgi:hypothetical protein